MKVLVFDLFGDLGHFRKFYTTSSPLTFPFPPQPTIRGIIGAIMGFGKEEYLDKTKDIYVGVKIVNPIKKLRTGLNLIFTKGSSGEFDPTLDPSRKGDANKTLRTQVKFEFVKDPRYRIYISASEEFLKKLTDMVKNHKTYYTVSLGLSELLADFSFVGVFDSHPIDVSDRADSVIPSRIIREIDIGKVQKIGKERIPVVMDSNRMVKMYEDVVFSVEGGAIYGKFTDLIKLGNGEVIYLWKQSQESTPIQESL
ncbi:CRISPR-associated protein Cas5, Hmari subtype [Hydrogenobacter thermophilus TK-6]|uniref:CRISPR-associated protein n=1 Tax=Hydrogenobacter thermophilus (strain DSM 6534 / IAM 12695 / TK-6) TaxID=608538 RepID=D3DIQ0_HYDTT|nr:type I-B CRISPR-associated protein Cas5b [Hydrogenobacter thermophilus]ADO45628.1 CRISPR-associated protein Cas5, Hmari subtype [Hydrogenobacter thermophilus TK-6]BAI69702.1 CRISPR-associated protein [Hydrogenobacter thermophilus TK-6]